MLLCTCRCEPASKQSETTVCSFIRSDTKYHIVVSNEIKEIVDSVAVLQQNKSDKCNQYLAFTLCLYLFRNCELSNVSDPSSGLQLSICTSKCSSLYKVADECIDDSNFITVGQSSNNTAVHELIAWTANFNCFDPSTYTLPNVPISNTSCDHISFIDGLLPSAGE